jgi:HD-GYP domain-containing protein (c-di-GMP phosphodiesterase class II)
MRYRTRAFLLYFVPVALLLTGSFWTIQRLVQSTVKDGLRSSLRENHEAIARLRSRTDLQNSRFLRVVGENASLKAGLQILLQNPERSDARETVGDQLRELCEQMGFDFLMVSDPDGNSLTGVVRTAAGIKPLTAMPQHSPHRGLLMQGDTIYQLASVPIDQGEENIGELSVGELFNLSQFSTPSVLLRDGKVLRSSLAGIPMPDMETALKVCRGKGECDIRLGGTEYVSQELPSTSFGDGYVVRSLQNVDSASAPLQSVLNHVFVAVSMAVVTMALLVSVFSSQSIVKPITGMISQLRKSESTGLLPEFTGNPSPVREIQELTSSFNRTAGAIREGRQRLQSAYVEFVGSLANALDARDRYTAGHSGRVSELACATAMALGVREPELTDIRIGALLHDIGKIGISDRVLMKPGKLTEQEFAIVKQHPEIGRRILEGVQGFAPYLPAVELHHENWDGTGYPKGQCGEETPLAPRIIHVCDAYDAMTTDRPYRRGMSHERASGVLRQFAGRQFDSRVVDAFLGISSGFASTEDESLRSLEHAIAGGS